MSFLSAFEHDAAKVGHALAKILLYAAEVGVEGAPVVSALNPVAGAALQLASGFIIEAEAKFQNPKSGPAKKEYVMNNMSSALTLAFAIQGKQVPANLLTILSGQVDSTVAMLNSIQQVNAIAKS